MAAFAQADRVAIRKWLGFGSIYLNQDPRLESAISSLQASSDGGSQPTADAQIEVYALLYGAAASTAPNGAALPARVGLAQIEYQIEQKMMTQQGAGGVGKGQVTIDSARETARLRIVGRSLVAKLATMLDTCPRRDAFGPAQTTGDPGGHSRRSPY